MLLRRNSFVVSYTLKFCIAKLNTYSKKIQ